MQMQICWCKQISFAELRSFRTNTKFAYVFDFRAKHCFMCILSICISYFVYSEWKWMTLRVYTSGNAHLTIYNTSWIANLARTGVIGQKTRCIYWFFGSGAFANMETSIHASIGAFINDCFFFFFFFFKNKSLCLNNHHFRIICCLNNSMMGFE